MPKVISIHPWEAQERAMSDAYLDSVENIPFSSIGGLDRRHSDEAMEIPDYIHPSCRDAYIRGYQAAALKMYGEDWRTCRFGWVPVLEIGPPTDDGSVQVTMAIAQDKR